MKIDFANPRWESGFPYAYLRAAPVWLGLCLCVAFIGYVALALTPSHYALGLQHLGVEGIRPLLFEARNVRSDEWIAFTPLVQTAVRGGFDTVNQVSPYHETLKGFWALPILDWSLIVKPQLWGFWLLPPAYAYSFYFACLWASFLLGYSVLFNQLGAPLRIAVVGALCLFFAGFVQVWWTSNAPTFAFAPWPLVVFLFRFRPMVKLAVLAWVSAVWIFALVYPPFIISAAFALGTLVLAFRRDALTKSNLLVGLGALALVGAAFMLYFGEIITVMRQTVYPGQRVSPGGGFEAIRLFAHVFPFFNTLQFQPFSLTSNECEIAVVSTLVPLTLACFVKYGSIAQVVRENGTAMAIVGIALSLMLAWMLLPVPVELGQLLLWQYVSPHRMIWGFGLLFVSVAIIIGSQCRFEVTWKRFAIFSGMTIAAWLGSKVGYTIAMEGADIGLRHAPSRTWFDWIPLLPFGLATFLITGTRIRKACHATVVLTAAGISGAVTYGTFNPFQQAHPIFDVPETPFLASLREQVEASPTGWAIVPRFTGALLSGAGVAAINHTLTTPQLDFFKSVFPDFDEAEFLQLFNRYAHIWPRDDIEAPFSPQADVIMVPVAAFAGAANSDGN